MPLMHSSPYLTYRKHINAAHSIGQHMAGKEFDKERLPLIYITSSFFLIYSKKRMFIESSFPAAKLYSTSSIKKAATS